MIKIVLLTPDSRDEYSRAAIVDGNKVKNIGSASYEDDGSSGVDTFENAVSEIGSFLAAKGVVEFIKCHDDEEYSEATGQFDD